MDFDLVRFGGRLREVRLNRELTLNDVFQKTKISIQTLSRIERGEAREIESKTLLVLSKWAELPLQLFEKSGTQAALTVMPKNIATPDAVELHLRADKNLDPKTAELLVKMFRAAYKQALSEPEE